MYFVFSILALQCFQKVTIKIQRVSHGVLIGFHWQDLPQPPTEPEPSTGGAGEPAEPSEPGPGGENAKVPRKRAKAGQGPLAFPLLEGRVLRLVPRGSVGGLPKLSLRRRLRLACLSLAFARGSMRPGSKKWSQGGGGSSRFLKSIVDIFIFCSLEFAKVVP